MRRLHHLFAVVLGLGMLATTSVGVAASPARADQSSATASTAQTAPAPVKKIRNRRKSAARPAPDSQVTANLNRESLQAAQSGKTPTFSGKTVSRKATARVAKGKTGTVKPTKARRNRTTPKTKKVQKA